jgi:hypothetical protein
VLILIVIWFAKSVTLDIKVDLNKLIEQAYHLSQGQDPEQHLDTDPPPSAVIPEEPSLDSPTTLAGLSGETLSRQQRRQLERQAKKKAGTGPRLA